MNEIAANLKQLRKELGLTQEQMAQKLHVTRQTVSAWERGQAQPSLDTLKQIAQALGVKEERLLYGAEKARPPLYRVTLWPVLGVIPAYVFLALIILPIPMTAWLGSHDMVFVLCGQLFLAILITLCYCMLKDCILNRDYYHDGEEPKEQDAPPPAE